MTTLTRRSLLKSTTAVAAANLLQRRASFASQSEGDLVFWSQELYVPESNDWLAESVRMAGEQGGFGVRVEFFSNQDYLPTQITAMEAGVVPDVAFTYAGALWHQNGYALDVQSLYDEIGASGDGWTDFAEMSSKASNQRIGIPTDVEPWFLHMRRDLFEAAGITLPFTSWEQMFQGFAAVNKPEENVYAFGAPFAVADFGGNALCFMWAHGGRLFDEAGNPTIDTPENLAGLQAYLNIYTNQLTPPGSVQWSNPGNNEAYLSGQAALISNTGSVLLSLRQDSPDLLAKTAVQAFPTATAAVPFVQMADNALLVINPRSPRIEQAMQIARTIMSPERYPTWLERSGSYFFSSLKAHQAIPFFAEDEFNRQIVETVIPYVLPPYSSGGRTPVYDDLSVAAFGDLLQAVTVREQSPEEALRNLQAKAEESREKFAG